MEVYESPKMEVIAFDSEDVIITSGSCDSVDGNICDDQNNNGGTP